ERARTIDRGPLARFVDQLDLDGGPAALHERATGRQVLPGDVPVIARALAELHETLGYHGHLCPAHIFVDGERVTFTDPLPVYPKLHGAAGYAFPIYSPALAPHDEGMLLRDIAALVGIAANALELGWDARMLEYVENIANRGIPRPPNVIPVLDEFHLRTSLLDDAVLRGWIDAAARLALDGYLPAPSIRPTSREPRPAAPGIARSLLTRFDFHAALGAIARRLSPSPSLLDFVAAERARAIEAYERPDVTAAYNARDSSFVAIAMALPELQAFYGDPPPAALPPVVHPPEVFEESYALRTLLLDLDRLLAPTPDTLAHAGGLLARARASAAALGDATVRSAAARRYVNFISR
nr:hypothetical protein [Deltaproteobacteria bacterium]